MNAVTLAEAREKLEQLIARAIMNAEPTIVSTESGQQAVIISLEEFNAWQETLYLLSTPANAEHLRNSIAESRVGL
jgi:antitoxin YefM